MSRAIASFSLLGLVIVVSACADDSGVGTQPGQSVTTADQTSSQAPTTPSPGPGPQNPPSSGTPASNDDPVMMPTAPAPSQPQTPEPGFEPTPSVSTGGAAGDGASSGSGGEPWTAGAGGVAGSGEAGGTGVDEDPMSAGGMGGGESDPDSEGAMPSAMCGSGAGMPNLNLQNTLISIPSSYDGSTPLPVVIAFHAAGNGNDQMQSIIGSTFQDEYIMLYPKSAGNEWNNQTDAPKVDAIFDALDASACYDQNRVFAAGHSSGAQFIVQRLCAGESRWRAVSPVASSVYCSSWEPVPALVIHGIGDQEREAYGLNDGNGEKDIVPYRTSNSCSESFTPVEVEGCMSGGVNVDPGCRDFDGCVERTRWCQHTDPQYGTSHHGVPCFGARVMKDFFDMYR